MAEHVPEIPTPDEVREISNAVFCIESNVSRDVVVTAFHCLVDVVLRVMERDVKRMAVSGVTCKCGACSN